MGRDSTKTATCAMREEIMNVQQDILPRLLVFTVPYRVYLPLILSHVIEKGVER